MPFLFLRMSYSGVSGKTQRADVGIEFVILALTVPYGSVVKRQKVKLEEAIRANETTEKNSESQARFRVGVNEGDSFYTELKLDTEEAIPAQISTNIARGESICTYTTTRTYPSGGSPIVSRH